MKKIIKKQKPIKNSNKFFHIIIALVTCFLLVTIIEWERGLLDTKFYEGDVALNSIYAPYDFTVNGDIDYTATEAIKKEILGSILYVYNFDTLAKELVLKKINSFFDSFQAIVSQEMPSEDKALKLKELTVSFNIPETLINSILELKDPQGFFLEVQNAIEKLMDQGVLPTQEASKLKEGAIKNIRLIDKSKKKEDVRPIDEFIALSDTKKKMEPLLISLKERKERALLVDFVNAVLSPNIIFDQLETELRREAAITKVQPVYKKVEVKKNELIVNKGERISKEHLVKLGGIAQHEPYTSKFGTFFGISILVILFMVLLALYIEFYEPDIVVGNKELVLLSIICVLMVLAAKLIVISPWPSTLIPVAAASMFMAILLNSRLAIITTCFLSILVGMISGNRLDIVAVSVAGGMIGIFAVRDVRRRSQLMVAGLSVGLANMSYLIGIGLLNSLGFSVYITESFLGLGNGIISGLVVTGLLPIFESVFKITTDISLLELSDLNHPLLKEMVIKAPGTYHHSLVVGNLAEAACEAIGANALLARVSAYFHDIGKIEKSSYFSENQPASGSMHDKLSPTMSSLIITNHVKNGVELAQKYKLNRRIVDIIAEHHGSGLVFYFFKRALEENVNEEVIEEGFRYPGPKPQTKEAACVLLADSVEAGSRALDDPAPASIKGLVRKIINNKFIDGQLDGCDLTLRDLEKIAEIFTHILTGIYHTRVEYPEETEKKRAK